MPRLRNRAAPAAAQKRIEQAVPSNYHRRIRLAGLTVLLGALALALPAKRFIDYWHARTLLEDPLHWDTLSERTIREASHDILAWPYGDYHDAFISLKYAGDTKSIPLIIEALGREDSANGIVSCG